ncbi:DNA-directed RNA polymerase III subunit RPC7 [Megalops cyprinoides]|uniref:DNA-directed RNA polymerase III subunit RPC7 n=1 Tax=Megalops cyprinoides TaxID=118141 RepID=UPI0018646199|nr:DNA-directed RNA polymerase III subunit RPC7 [Megalops cyprinoides]
MSARGRGRGVAAFTFNIDALGITRGSMPETAFGPKPLFPNTDYKPVPLKTGDDEDYMLALKQEMRGTMQRLPFNIPLPKKKADVERYKEKYEQDKLKDHENTWTPDWQRLPKELMPQKKKVKKKTAVKKKTKEATSKQKQDLLTKLDELEKKDTGSDEEKEDKKAEGGEEEEEEVEGEEYDEEEFEEENDYIASYFEDGDDYGGGSDDNMDEATY